MEIFILEDDPSRISWFASTYKTALISDNAEGAKRILEGRKWDIVFLDHDLGGKVFVNEKDTNTGSEVVRWVIENKVEIDRIIIHSLNWAASKNMLYSLREAGYIAVKIPFLFKEQFPKC